MRGVCSENHCPLKGMKQPCVTPPGVVIILSIQVHQLLVLVCLTCVYFLKILSNLCMFFLEAKDLYQGLYKNWQQRKDYGALAGTTFSCVSSICEEPTALFWKCKWVFHCYCFHLVSMLLRD